MSYIEKEGQLREELLGQNTLSLRRPPNSPNIKNSFTSTGRSFYNADDDADDNEENCFADFKKLLQQHRARTERTVPFTLQQVEDAIFLDDKHLLSLEYIFYQRNGNYFEAVEEKEPQLYEPLGIENYDFKQRNNSIKAFCEKPISYKVLEKDYLRTSADELMDTEYEAVEKVEPLISLYRVTPTGQIEHEKEMHFKYDGQFHPSVKNKMRLKLSSNKKVVSVCHQIHGHVKQGTGYQYDVSEEEGSDSDSVASFFDAEYIQQMKSYGNDGEGGFNEQKAQIVLFAWNTATLEPIEISPKLKQQLFDQPCGSLVNMFFTGNNNEYLLQILKKKSPIVRKQRLKWFEYKIFWVKTGELIYEFDNRLQDQDIRVIGLLAFGDQYKNDPDKRKGPDGGKGLPKSQVKDQGLLLSFFFARPESQKRKNERESNMSILSNQGKPKKEGFEVINRVLRLNDLLQLKDLDQRKHIIEKAIDKYSKIEKGIFVATKGFPEMTTTINLPAAWFIKRKNVNEISDLDWRTGISLNSNRSLAKLAFINKKKRSYLAFTPCGSTYHETSITIGRRTVASHGRNQFTKEQLYLIQRYQSEESTLTMIMDHRHNKTVHFDDDHSQHCSPDLSCRLLGSIDSGSYLLQTLVLDNNQHLVFHTHSSQLSDNQDQNHQDKIVRTVACQDFAARFPIFAYNIGVHKLILLDTQRQGRQFVLNIEKNEKFINFIEFRDLSSLGFYPEQLRIGTCSKIVFLTLNTITQEQFVNIMLVDPYYDPCQIVLFKSTKSFAKNLDNLRSHDQAVKRIIFSTARSQHDENVEIRLLTQYFDHYTITVMAKGSDDPLEFDYNQCEYENYQQRLLVGESHDTAPVRMLMDDNGHIYYIQYSDGQCIFKEIVPHKSDIRNHIKIFDVKSDRCLGFSASPDGTQFFFIDDFKNVTVLERVKESRLLQETSVLQLKDKDRMHLCVKHDYEQMIISGSYLIHSMNLLYICNGDRADGVLEMEKLNGQNNAYPEGSQTIYCQYGPIMISGTSNYVSIIADRSSRSVSTCIYQLPDSYSVTMIADYEHKCEMSTFLKNGEILIKVDHRFLIFNENGNFICQVAFQDLQDEQLKQIADQRSSYQSKDQQVTALRSRAAQQSSEVQRLVRLSSKLRGQMLEGGGPEPVTAQKTGTQPLAGQALRMDGSDAEEGQENGDEEQQIGPWNRMQLVKISKNNTHFLFEDKIKQVLRVYKLERLGFSMSRFQTKTFRFIPVYDVDVLKMKMMRNFFIGSNINYRRIVTHLTGCGNMKIDDEGTLSLSFNSFDTRSDFAKFYVHGAIIQKAYDIDSQSLFRQFDEYVFKTLVTFEEKSLSAARNATSKLIDEQTNLLEIEILRQFNLPANLKNDEKSNQILNQIKQLRFKLQNTVKQDIINNEILIFYGGSNLQYAKFDKNWLKLQQIDDAIDSLEVVPIKLQLSVETEIFRVWETKRPNEIQIIAKDIRLNLLIIVTWNLEYNMEVNMFQIESKPGNYPENYIVRGMNLRQNYYVSNTHVWDLEINLPIIRVKRNTNNKAINFKKIEENQRKISNDKSRILSIEKSNIILFPANYMELMFWKNLKNLGNKPALIDQCTTLQHFGQIHNNSSLFHIFVHDSELIEIIYNKYISALNGNFLKPDEKHIPLTLLSPNKEGKTALELAKEVQRPKAFELMINLLTGFDEFSYSKMILTQFFHLATLHSETAEKFFDNCFMQPITMREEITLPWPGDLQQYVFSSHTLLITADQLLQVINQKGAPASNDESKCQRPERSYNFEFDEGNDGDDSEHPCGRQRISMKALDYDWVFEGDNCEKLLVLLVKHGKNSLFRTTAVKAFIEYLWNQYQPVIVSKIFYPYCAYIITQMVLSSGLAGSYFKILSLPLEEREEKAATQMALGTLINGVTVLALILWLFFFLIEFRQLIGNPIGYLSGVTNWVDMASQITSVSFFIALDSTILSERVLVKVETLRIWGGLACMLLWIRMFRWMRLFKETAHFISLISQILADLKVFNFMWLIVMAAFGNFYYTINNNTKMTEEEHYVGPYTHIQYVDALIQMYLFSIGELDIEAQRAEPCHITGFIAFIVSTFVLSIIFLNLIIAIISDTYQDMQDKSEENGLREQANVILDMYWLLDIKELTKGQRYIIHLETVDTLKHKSVDQQQMLTRFQLAVQRKQDEILHSMVKKVDAFERQSRAMAKANYALTLTSRETMTEFDKKLNKCLKYEKLIHEKKGIFGSVAEFLGKAAEDNAGLAGGQNPSRQPQPLIQPAPAVAEAPAVPSSSESANEADAGAPDFQTFRRNLFQAQNNLR